MKERKEQKLFLNGLKEENLITFRDTMKRIKQNSDKQKRACLKKILPKNIL